MQQPQLPPMRPGLGGKQLRGVEWYQPLHPPPKKCLFFQLPPGRHQHYLSLAWEEADGANHLLGDPDTGCFFFRCISQLRCGTDGESTDRAPALAPGASEAHEADGTKQHGGRQVPGSSGEAGRRVKALSSPPCPAGAAMLYGAHPEMDGPGLSVT